MEKKFTYVYHHWRASQKFMDIVYKRDKSPETLRLVEKRQEHSKPGNLHFRFDSNLNRKMWVPRKPDKNGRVEVGAIDSMFLFTNKEENT